MLAFVCCALGYMLARRRPAGPVQLTFNVAPTRLRARSAQRLTNREHVWRDGTEEEFRGAMIAGILGTVEPRINEIVNLAEASEDGGRSVCSICYGSFQDREGFSCDSGHFVCGPCVLGFANVELDARRFIFACVELDCSFRCTFSELCLALRDRARSGCVVEADLSAFEEKYSRVSLETGLAGCQIAACTGGCGYFEIVDEESLGQTGGLWTCPVCPDERPHCFACDPPCCLGPSMTHYLADVENGREHVHRRPDTRSWHNRVAAEVDRLVIFQCTACARNIVKQEGCNSVQCDACLRFYCYVCGGHTGTTAVESHNSFNAPFLGHLPMQNCLLFEDGNLARRQRTRAGLLRFVASTLDLEQRRALAADRDACALLAEFRILPEHVLA